MSTRLLQTVEVPVVRCPTCETPWVLRLALLRVSGEERWIYQRDCKHKASPAATPLNEAAPLNAFLRGA